jgi:hypothetical protein
MGCWAGIKASDPLAARDDADTIEGNNTNELVTASIAHSAPEAKPGNGKASMFGVPRKRGFVSSHGDIERDMSESGERRTYPSVALNVRRLTHSRPSSQGVGYWHDDHNATLAAAPMAG